MPLRATTGFRESSLVVSKTFAGFDIPEARGHIHLYSAVPLATAVFFGTPMGRLYHVPPKHRYWYPTENCETTQTNP